MSIPISTELSVQYALFQLKSSPTMSGPSWKQLRQDGETAGLTASVIFFAEVD